MNIFKIDLEKLKIEINEYIYNKSNNPVLLMNYETFKILNEYNHYFFKETKYFTWTLFGCYICIANWLSTGEVEVR